jgi:hypothetical protein
MTPKEKAISIYNKYVQVSYPTNTEMAKMNALIAVEEILNNWKDEATIQFPYGKVINYWNIVKIEIEKL